MNTSDTPTCPQCGSRAVVSRQRIELVKSLLLALLLVAPMGVLVVHRWPVLAEDGRVSHVVRLAVLLVLSVSMVVKRVFMPPVLLHCTNCRRNFRAKHP